jgi:hypothetical protein
MAAIEIAGQLHNAPYDLRDTGEPPVERNLVGVKSSQGYALFLLRGHPLEPQDCPLIISFIYAFAHSSVARHVHGLPSAFTTNSDLESRLKDSSVSGR